MNEKTLDSNNSKKLSAAKQALLRQRLKGRQPESVMEKIIPKLPIDAPKMISSMQQRLWYLDQLQPNDIAYNIQWALKIEGHLNVPHLEASLQDIVDRHEILRSRYRLEGEQVVMQVVDGPPTALSEIVVKNDDPVTLDDRLREEGRRPFDLYHGPVLRALLFQVDESRYVLTITVHHIAFDGWSYGIFLNELVDFYERRCAGRSERIAPPSLQYSDYAHWHQKWLEGPEVRRQMDYWVAQLGGELPILGMPTDFPRPAHQSVEGAVIRRFVESPILDQLAALGRTENATLFMVLLSAFYILLNRYTGQDDIIVGTPIANRTQAEVAELVGLLANTLVLRIHMDAQASFQELLRQVRDMCLDAFANPDAPFELLVEKLNPERDMSMTPVYQSMFAYQSNQGYPARMVDLRLSQIAVPMSVARTDLSLWLDHSEEGLTLSLEYCTDLFAQETMTRFLENYLTLLGSILRTPKTAIDQLELVSNAEKKLLEMGQSATDAGYPADLCLHQAIDAQCDRTPDQNAIQFGHHQITFRELRERANRLAHFLRREKVAPDTFIGVCLERSIDMVVGVLGILKSGAAYLPLDPDYPVERLAYMLSDSKAAVVITQSSLQSRLQIPDGISVICLDDDHGTIAEYPSTDPEPVSQPRHLAYIIYTSGSTGKPKGVQVPHQAVVNFLFSMRREPGMTKADVLLAVTTLSFDIHVLEIFLPLIVGAKVVIADRDSAADGEKLVGLLSSSQATVMQATPSTWRLMLAAGWEGCSELRLLCGGEAFPKDLLRELLPRVAQVWNMYGPTETTVWSSCCLLSDADQPIFIGKPIANTQIYILDRHLQRMPIGVPGELHIGGDGVTRGYLNRDNLTRKQFIPDPFRDEPNARLYKTGDLARLRSDGQLEYLSRIDTQVKVRGFRIELGEIESVLSSHPSIEASVATVTEDRPGDVRLVGYIVLNPSHTADVTALRDHLRQKLPDYMIPQNFIQLERFPLTPAGKIDRKNLPKPSPGGVLKTGDYVAPRSALEMQLTQLWEKILGTRPISVTDNFFDVGGHSLLAVRLFASIERMTGEKLPLALLYQAPSIAQLATIMEESNWQAGWSTLVPINPGGSRPPLFLVHGAGGNVLLYRRFAQYLGEEQPVYGLQARGLNGQEPYFNRIEDMAAEYIQEIKKLQPEGPYFLGGYCMGGGIAYEMARQLRGNDDEVSVVGMFDTFNGYRRPGLYGRFYHQYQRLMFHIQNYVMIESPNDRQAFLSEKYQEAIRRFGLWLSVKSSKVLYFLKIRRKKPLLIMDHINDKAAIDYVAKPYPGRIHLFKTKSAYRGYEDPLMGWGDGLVEDPTIHQLNVFPGGTLNEPFVQELAEKFKQCLQGGHS